MEVMITGLPMVVTEIDVMYCGLHSTVFARLGDAILMNRRLKEFACRVERKRVVSACSFHGRADCADNLLTINTFANIPTI